VIEDITVHTDEYTTGSGDTAIRVVRARPSEGGPSPAIVVIHENKGLTPYIGDVALQLAKEGYVAVAPDLVSRVGGTEAYSTQDEVTAALKGIDRALILDDLKSVVDGLVDMDGVDGKALGAIGFCFGGGLVWSLATKDSRIRAAVPFYGPVPPLEEVPQIEAAVLAVYGGLDERINKGIPDIEPAMEQHGKVFEKAVYEDATHAFHNPANEEKNSNRDAAAAAWPRAVAWFGKWLRGE